MILVKLSGVIERIDSKEYADIKLSSIQLSIGKDIHIAVANTIACYLANALDTEVNLSIHGRYHEIRPKDSGEEIAEFYLDERINMDEMIIKRSK